MKQATKRFLSLILAFVFVLAAFLVYFDLIQPAYSEAQAIQAERLGKQDFVTSQKKVVGQVQDLIAKYQGEQQLGQAISYVLPASADPSSVLGQMSGLAAVNHLSLQSFSVNAPSLEGNRSGGSSLVKPMGVLSFEARLTGSYEDFKNFLTNAETNIRLFDAKTLSLQPAGSRPNDDLFAYDVVFSAYYQSQ